MHTLATHDGLERLIDGKLNHGLAGGKERCAETLIQPTHALLVHDGAQRRHSAARVHLALVDWLCLYTN